MPVFKCQKPRFTRPIGADVLANQKLALPKAFVRQSDIGGLGKVTVTVPSGKEWEMRLRKSDREVSLAVGWQEFVNFYSLKRGYMLEFTYEGDSMFSVTIYDATLCEILYPMPMMNEESKDSDESSTFNDDDYPDQSSDSQSKASEGSDDSTHSESNQSDSSISVPGKKEGTQGVKSAAERCETSTPRTRRGLSHLEHLIALKRVAAFQSTNPFFKAVIYPAHIHRAMYVPREFSDKNLKGKSESLLQIGDRRWSVKLCSDQNNRMFLSAGWSRFVQENSIQVGDVCVFELINKDTAQLSVLLSPRHVMVD